MQFLFFSILGSSSLGWELSFEPRGSHLRPCSCLVTLRQPLWCLKTPSDKAGTLSAASHLGGGKSHSIIDIKPPQNLGHRSLKLILPIPDHKKGLSYFYKNLCFFSYWSCYQIKKVKMCQNRNLTYVHSK